MHALIRGTYRSWDSRLPHNYASNDIILMCHDVFAGVSVLWNSPSLAGVSVLWHSPSFGVLAGVSVWFHSTSLGAFAGVSVLWICYEFVVDLSVRWVWRYITGIIVVVAVVVICYGGLRQALAWCLWRRVVACSCQLRTTVTSRVQYACLLDRHLLFTGGRFPESREISGRYLAAAFLRKGRLCGYPEQL